jgi:hypothetical protein
VKIRGVQVACLCFSAACRKEMSAASCRRLQAGSLRSPEEARESEIAAKNQSRSFPKITQALIPPNPNELLMM